MKNLKARLEIEIQTLRNDLYELEEFEREGKKKMQIHIRDIKEENLMNNRNIIEVEKQLESEKKTHRKKLNEAILCLKQLKNKIQDFESFFMQNRFCDTQAEDNQCINLFSS